MKMYYLKYFGLFSIIYLCFFEIEILFKPLINKISLSFNFLFLFYNFFLIIVNPIIVTIITNKILDIKNSTIFSSEKDI